MQEIELKFQVPDRAQAREALVQRLQSLGASGCRMQAAYFDTPQRDLARAGVALRLRLEDGHWMQTLKARGEGLVQRLEHNQPREAAPDQRPLLDLAVHADHPAGQTLLRLLGRLGRSSADLQVQYETVFDRLALQAGGDSGLRVEVALDRGEVRAHPAGQPAALPLCELEFELLEGSLTGWLAWLRPWVGEHGLWLDLRSKAERGDRLARGLPAPLWPVDQAAGARAALDGVLRHAAELIDATGDVRHHLALQQGLALLLHELGGSGGAADRLGPLRDLQQALAQAGPADGGALLRAPQVQACFVDALLLTLPD